MSRNLLCRDVCVAVYVLVDAVSVAQRHLQSSSQAPEGLIEHYAMGVCSREEGVANRCGVEPFSSLDALLVLGASVYA